MTSRSNRGWSDAECSWSWQSSSDAAGWHHQLQLDKERQAEELVALDARQRVLDAIHREIQDLKDSADWAELERQWEEYEKELPK